MGSAQHGGSSAAGRSNRIQARAFIEDAADEFERRVEKVLEDQLGRFQRSVPEPDPDRLEKNRRIMASVLDEVAARFEDRMARLLAEQALPPAGGAVTSVPATEQIAHDLRDLNSCFDELMTQLRDKEQQIKRLAEGYDAYIFKRFLYPFVLVADAIDGLIESDLSKQDALARVRTLLVNQALDACGVEAFSPPPGALYRETAGIDDTISIVQTADPERDGVIESSVRPGYQIRPVQEGAPAQVILKAKVRVYSHQSKRGKS